MILLDSNFPIAQGLFTGFIIFLMFYIYKLLSKAGDIIIDKAFLNTNNVNILLNYGIKFYKKGKINEAIQVYEKVINIEPFNTTALVSLGNIFFSTKKYDDAERFYKILHKKYFIDDNDSKDSLNSKLLTQLYISIYRYGYILNNKGLIEMAAELKNLSLGNKNFVDNCKNLQSDLSY